jgi:hypothetical protein
VQAYRGFESHPLRWLERHEAIRGERIAASSLGRLFLCLRTFVRMMAKAGGRRGGMADAEDLKSSGRERPCGFDSHRRYFASGERTVVAYC